MHRTAPLNPRSSVLIIVTQKGALLQNSKPGLSKISRGSTKSSTELEAPPADEQEQDFWNTPGAAARTLHFTGELLTDEQIDIDNMTGPLSSPMPAPVPRMRGTSSRALQFTARSRDASVEPEVQQAALHDAKHGEPSKSPPPEAEVDEDVTVMLQKPPSAGSSRRTVRSPPERGSSRPTSSATEAPPRRERAKSSGELETIVVRVAECSSA